MTYLSIDLDHGADHLATSPLLHHAVAELSIAEIVILSSRLRTAVVALVYSEDVGAGIADSNTASPHLHYLDVVGKGKA